MQTGLPHGEGVVALLVVRSSGEVGADAEVRDGDVVVVEVQRDESSDLAHRPVLVEPTVHLWCAFFLFRFVWRDGWLGGVG